MEKIMSKNTKKMTVYLEPDFYNFVDSWIKMSGASKNQFLKSALDSFVGDLQARYNERMRQLNNEVDEPPITKE